MIVELSEAKDALRVTSTAEDNVINGQLLEVTAIFLQYLGYDDLDEYLYAQEGANEDELYYQYGDGWTITPDLPAVQILRAAIFVGLATRYDDRTATPLSAAVKSILRRYRDPVME
jgi:hypothetical protein